MLEEGDMRVGVGVGVRMGEGILEEKAMTPLSDVNLLQTAKLWISSEIITDITITSTETVTYVARRTGMKMLPVFDINILNHLSFQINILNFHTLI